MATMFGMEDWGLDPFMGTTTLLDPSALTTTQRRRERPAAFPIDVIETPDSYKIKADLAGFSKDNIQVSFEDQTLRINAERAEEKKEEGHRYHITERRHGHVTRGIRLPLDADQDHVSAKYEHGVLRIDVHKRPETERRKQIQVA